ncbi:hypothetical protein GCM10027610_071600 [Dactylosporangium cerinum]
MSLGRENDEPLIGEDLPRGAAVGDDDRGDVEVRGGVADKAPQVRILDLRIRGSAVSSDFLKVLSGELAGAAPIFTVGLLRVDGVSQILARRRNGPVRWSGCWG